MLPRAGWFIGAVVLFAAAPAHAQVQRFDDETTLTVSRGSALLINTRAPVQRIAVGNPDIADAVVVSARELVVNGKDYGTTTVIVWTTATTPTLYTVEVTADAGAAERDLRRLIPSDTFSIMSRGRALVVSGRARTAEAARRAIELVQAGAPGVTVIDNITAPGTRQVLLSVQIAEVNRSAGRELEGHLRLLNPKDLEGDGDIGFESLANGVLNFFLAEAGAELDATLRWLKSRGEFKTLAEPNLLTLPGREASFLAGGEFPFPVVRGAGETQNVTIEFREFGVRLSFTPVITNAGLIRLKVAPEVSSLDFANGLRFGGFAVPTILTRRAETEVELREGQFLAIAGLSNDEMRKTVDKVPILGDIPLLGLFFRNSSSRQSRTELLVLVTPRLVEASDAPAPLPTGPAESWEWDGSLRRPVRRQ